MNEQAEKLISIPLAILESILASYIFDRYSKNADAACFNKVDHSTLARIQDKIKEEYEKEQLHSYITQSPLLPNSRYPFISDEAKSDFIKKFYNAHPDLKSVGSEKVSECLGKYVDEINNFLNQTLSADAKFLAKQVNDAKNSLTNEIHRSKNDILSAIKNLPSPNEERNESTPRSPFYKIGIKNKLFSGRLQKISDIMLKLNEDKLVFLTGKGGMGKSQIAHEIIFRSQDKYKLIMWFQANTKAELLNEFNDAAITYHLITEQKDSFDHVTPLLSAFIGKFPSTLIVYDGADDIPIEFLASNCIFDGADIMVTTQNSNIDSDEFSVIPIDAFTPEESVSFLLNYSSSRKQEETDTEILPYLCDLLENYPLALEYARAYVNKTQSSFAEYMQIYNEHKNDILRNTVTKYSKTAYTAWKISYDKIIRQSAAAKDLLCIISFLDPYDIPLHDIFLRTEQYSSYALNQIITTIQNYSLFTMHEDLVDIHGITQEFIRIQMSADQEYQQYYEEALKFLSGLIPDKITNASERDLVNRLIKHAMQLVSYKPDTCRQDVYHFALNITTKLYILGNYTQTIEFAYRQLELYNFITPNFNLLQMVTFLTQACHYTGRDDIALTTLQKYSSIVENAKELKDDEKGCLLLRYKNIEGIILKDQGKFPLSLKAYKDALKYMDDSSPDSDAEMKCNILNNIGIIYKHLRQYETALEYYDHALTYSNNEKHLLLRTYGNMASAYKRLAQFESSLQYAGYCLNYSVELGDKRNECICLGNLGDCYISMRQYEQAEPLIKKSMKIAEEINFSIGIINAYHNLGILAFSRHNHVEAKRYWEESLKRSYEVNYKEGIDSALRFLEMLP